MEEFATPLNVEKEGHPNRHAFRFHDCSGECGWNLHMKGRYF